MKNIVDVHAQHLSFAIRAAIEVHTRRAAWARVWGPEKAEKMVDDATKLSQQSLFNIVQALDHIEALQNAVQGFKELGDLFRRLGLVDEEGNVAHGH